METCSVCTEKDKALTSRNVEFTEKMDSLKDDNILKDEIIKGSKDKIIRLAENLKKGETEVENFRKINETLTLEHRTIKEAYDELKRVITEADTRDYQRRDTNSKLQYTLQKKEKQTNTLLDDMAKLKLQFEEVKIENERINLKLKSYYTASFVLDHIIPKPISKNKDGEDLYNNGDGVGYNRVPPPANGDISKKNLGVYKALNIKLETKADKLPENIDVTFEKSSDEDKIDYEVVKNVVNNVLKSDSDSDSTKCKSPKECFEDEECYLNNYIPKSFTQAWD
ncbi:hypothetical protein Hanom_Chr02g00135341 [Helianthus anomalus]